MRPWKQGQTRASETELEIDADHLEDGVIGAEGDVFYLDQILDLAAE